MLQLHGLTLAAAPAVRRFSLVQVDARHSDDDEEEGPRRPTIAEFCPHTIRKEVVKIWQENQVPLPLIVLTGLAAEANKMDFGLG